MRQRSMYKTVYKIRNFHSKVSVVLFFFLSFSLTSSFSTLLLFDYSSLVFFFFLELIFSDLATDGFMDGCNDKACTSSIKYETFVRKCLLSPLLSLFLCSLLRRVIFVRLSCCKKFLLHERTLQWIDDKKKEIL